MIRIERDYPRDLPGPDGSSVRVDLLRDSDRDALVAIGREIPEHDRLFLHRDISQAAAVEAWLDELERGRLASIVVRGSRAISGFATVEPEADPWSQHVAELRVMVAPGSRRRGLGRLLTQEGFSLALSAGIEKITARMTTDQKAAIETFLGLGFRSEALFREHVRDRDGRKHDLLVLSHDVRRFHALLEAYGVPESVGA